MSRASRKKAERIYTQRAKAGFPPVSNLKLTKDGEVVPRTSRGYTVSFAPSFWESLSKVPLNEKEQLDKDIWKAVGKLSRNPYLGEPIGVGFVGKFLNKLKWLRRELDLLFGGESSDSRNLP